MLILQFSYKTSYMNNKNHVDAKSYWIVTRFITSKIFAEDLQLPKITFSCASLGVMLSLTARSLFFIKFVFE